MTTHPIDSALQDGVSPLKSDLRAISRRVLFAIDLNEVQTNDLSGTHFIILAVSGVPRTFVYNAAAGAPDNDTIIEDSVGNRFQATPFESSFLTAAIVNAALGTEGLDADTIPDSSAGTKLFFVLDDSGVFKAATPAEVYAWFNTQAVVAGNENTVIKLAENIKRQCGSLNKAVLFADGSIGISGSGASGATGDVQAGNVGRFIRAGFHQGDQQVFTKFWAGRGSFFALDESSVLWAIGENSNGQLGLGDTTDRLIWTRVQYFIDNTLTVVEVEPVSDNSNNINGTHFRLSNGHLYYAGANAAGEAGDGTTTQRTTPVRCGTLTGVTKVWSGGGSLSNTGCVFALASNVLYSWGYNGTGCLGHGNTTSPVTSPVSTGISDVIDCYPDYSTLILKSDGTVWGTGYNAFGELGQGDTTQRTSFIQLTALGSDVFDLVTSRGDQKHCAALKGSAGAGTCWTWGRNTEGQCATGNTTSPKSTPSAPTAAFQGSADEVRCWGSAASSGLFVRKDNELWGTGYNTSGNLARGDVTSVLTTFGRVVGVRGNIQQWGAMGHTNTAGLIVLTDVACLTAGYNNQGQTGQQDPPSRTIIGQLGIILY